MWMSYLNGQTATFDVKVSFFFVKTALNKTKFFFLTFYVILKVVSSVNFFLQRPNCRNHKENYQHGIPLPIFGTSQLLGNFTRLYNDDSGSEQFNFHVCSDTSCWNWRYIFRTNVSPDIGR